MSDTIVRKKVTKYLKKSTCRNCGNEFIARRSWSLFCNVKCRFQYWSKMHPRISLIEKDNVEKKEI